MSRNSNRSMQLLRHTPNSWRWATGRVAFVMIITATCVVNSRGQTRGTPYALSQYSTMTGSDSTITASRVPVVTAAGNTIYKNITIQFDVDSDGNLTLSPENPKISDAPPLVVSSFSLVGGICG